MICLNVYIYFTGGDHFNLHHTHIPDSDLRSLLDWFRDANGSEVKTVRYDMNGTTGEYIFYRKNIEYIKIQND